MRIAARMKFAAAWMAAAWLGTLPTLAQQQQPQQEPTTEHPDVELRTFEVAEGFEVNLFASEPMIVNPLNINWDAHGRMWVATSEIYPQILPGQTPSDKIVILEDTDGDGRADRHTVFADNLLIPTGVLPGDGGVYVAASTELLHLVDTDGDGKADRTRVVLSGFGTGDTHHLIHSLRWGPDGRMYFSQSLYIHSHVETPHGVHRLHGGGIWRFDPRTWELDVYVRGFVNTWGHEFDRFGQSFATDGAYDQGIHYAFPGSAHNLAVNWPRILHGLNQAQPKLCGLAIVNGRHMPDDWNNAMIGNDFRGHRVYRFKVSEQPGTSNYISIPAEDLIRSTHPAFRPVDAKIGPDGALYIVDWCNPIINHGEVDFRDPRRDKRHGRIWRVTAKGRPLVQPPTIAGAPVEELFDALSHVEDWTRSMARRELVERGRDEVLPVLDKCLAQLTRDDAWAEHHRLEALWVKQGLNAPDRALLERVLAAGDGRVRAAAVRVLADWRHHFPDTLDQLTKLVHDDHPRVRLEAVNALRLIGTPRAVEVAFRVLDHPTDVNLDYALWHIAWSLRDAWLAKLATGEVTFDGDMRKLGYALKAAGDPAAVQPLVKLIQSQAVPAESQPEMLNLIAQSGGPTELGMVYELAVSDRFTAAQRAEMLLAVARAMRQRDIRPAADWSQLEKLLLEGQAPLAAAAAQLAAVARTEALRPALARLAGDANRAEIVQRAAAEALASFNGEADRATLIELAQPAHPWRTRVLAVSALTGIDPAVAAPHAAQLLKQTPADQDATPIFQAFLRRKGGPEALAEALEKSDLPEAVALAGTRAAESAGVDASRLHEVLQRLGGPKPSRRDMSADQLVKLIERVRTQGDAHRGEAVFRRADLACMQCHAIGGAGGQVGPDLRTIGTSAPVDYLIESILQPDAKIKEGYHQTVVHTNDFEVIAGVVAASTDSHIILRDASGYEHRIDRADIESSTTSQTSIMPAGLADLMSDAELIDLVKFLSVLGADSAFTVGTQPVVRRWRVLHDGPEVAAVLASNASQAANDTSNALWTPAYSTVSGALPLQDLPVVAANGRSLRIVRFEVELAAPSRLTLSYNDATGVTVLTPLANALTAGRHAVTLAIDAGRTTPLRIEVHAEDPTVYAQIIAGR